MLTDWIQREAIGCSSASSESLNATIDQVVGSLGSSVQLLGLGEALHGGEDILLLRNLLFQRLVEAHGYTAIAAESSFPRARIVNEYVAGRGPHSYDGVKDIGFSHGFGQVEANRELVEWMRSYNAGASPRAKLRFYGFDSPTEMMSSDSPRQLLYFSLDYLSGIGGGTDGSREFERRQRIDALLGADADWENPAAMMDPTKSVGLSPEATALRIETENLVTELQIRRPELTAKSDRGRYLEAAQYAALGRWMLDYHAVIANSSGDSSQRLIEGLGIRDAMMADNLIYIVQREGGGGKVLAFAHNSHLKRGQAQWQLGPHALAWWPAGAQLNETLGERYAVIGTGLGISDANGIGTPEPSSLEALLTTSPGLLRFLPTHKGEQLSAAEIAAIPTRSGSTKNPTYFPLNAQSLTDFDWLAILDSTSYTRGGPPLPN